MSLKVQSLYSLTLTRQRLKNLTRISISPLAVPVRVSHLHRIQTIAPALLMNRKTNDLSIKKLKKQYPNLLYKKLPQNSRSEILKAVLKSFHLCKNNNSIPLRVCP